MCACVVRLLQGHKEEGEPNTNLIPASSFFAILLSVYASTIGHGGRGGAGAGMHIRCPRFPPPSPPAFCKWIMELHEEDTLPAATVSQSPVTSSCCFVFHHHDWSLTEPQALAPAFSLLTLQIWRERLNLDEKKEKKIIRTGQLTACLISNKRAPTFAPLSLFLFPPRLPFPSPNSSLKTLFIRLPASHAGPPVGNSQSE